MTSEYCDKEKLPRITEKTFLVSNQLYSETAEFQFYQLAQQHSSVKQFLLLNMLRIIGLLSTPWMECGIRWSRVVFLCGSGEKLSRYLQIYERGREIQRPHSVNVKKEELESYFRDEKDTVVMLEDSALASDYLKKNGVNAVAYLNNEIFDRMNSCSMDYNYLTVVFSERLGQLMPHEKAWCCLIRIFLYSRRFHGEHCFRCCTIWTRKLLSMCAVTFRIIGSLSVHAVKTMLPLQKAILLMAMFFPA